MTFEEYAGKFRREAQDKGLQEADILVCLSYAKRLLGHNMPLIYDGQHLANLVGYKYEYICKANYAPEKHYRCFEIPKRNGGKRIISEPLPSLKEIQLWILHHILYLRPVHPHAKAYVPGKKLKENLRFHKKQKVVLTLDIHDFFGSINRQAVKAMFREWGYSQKLSSILSHLCCLDEKLPQGAPTSPYLSNLYLYDFDKSIADYCRSQKDIKDSAIRYTRYADDMAFSGDFNPREVIELVKAKLSALGLMLNEQKTKVMTANMRQIVTGCVVNQRMQLPREERREIRQTMHFIMTYGLSDHIRHLNITKHNYLNHLIGRISFACYLNPSDEEMKKYLQFLKEVNGIG